MLDWVQKRAGNKRNVSEKLLSIPDGKEWAERWRKHFRKFSAKYVFSTESVVCIFTLENSPEGLDIGTLGDKISVLYMSFFLAFEKQVSSVSEQAAKRTFFPLDTEQCSALSSLAVLFVFLTWLLFVYLNNEYREGGISEVTSRPCQPRQIHQRFSLTSCRLFSF